MSTESAVDATHARFLKAELALGFTFTTIASQRHETGFKEAAEKSMMNAEKSCETVTRFLSDPKHNKRLTDVDIRDLTAELERLRKELMKLEDLRTKN